MTNEIQDDNDDKVQVRFIRARDGVPVGVSQKMGHDIEEAKNNTCIILNLAINYVGQAELLHAVKSIAAEAVAGSLDVAKIDNQVVEDHLYTAGLPAPDLLIRPGGDLRISNFLLWQIAYAEIWTTKTYWPDFTPDHLVDAILAYQGRERRFGGLIEK